MKRTTFSTKQRQPMKRKASKPRTRKSATGPLADPTYFARVKSLPCCCCGAAGPSDGHHCKDRPPADLRVYRYFGGHADRSADFDAIPLCRACHDLFHRDHGEYARRYGPDYQHIPPTRATLSEKELDI
mgnify:CR=1 FL=1